MLEKSEAIAIVRNQLLSRTEYYDLYGQLDDLSAGAGIADIQIIEINYENTIEGRTDFSGVLLVETIKEFGVTRSSFTGVFKGYFDDVGIELETASLDVSSTSIENS